MRSADSWVVKEAGRLYGLGPGHAVLFLSCIGHCIEKPRHGFGVTQLRY